jgi:DNA repair protein SbcD/Mre11
MKLLHTSDWHIGRILQTRKRYEEFEAFFDWLAETVEEREIDVNDPCITSLQFCSPYKRR